VHTGRYLGTAVQDGSPTMPHIVKAPHDQRRDPAAHRTRPRIATLGTHCGATPVAGGAIVRALFRSD
jgi:hypothetical protein